MPRTIRLQALVCSLFAVLLLSGCPPPPAPTPPRYSVRLLAVGVDHDAVVAAVASGTGYDVRIAEGLVKRAPMPVRSGIPRAEADALAEALRGAGADVAVIEIPD